MRPQVCEVCDRGFARDGGELITFAADDATRAFDERAEQHGFVGHRPSDGWFCSDHVDAARALVASSLAEAVSVLRSRHVTPAPDTPELAPTQPRPVPIEPLPERTPPGKRVVGQPAPDRPVFPRRGRDEPSRVRLELAVDVDIFELHDRLRAFRPVVMAVVGLADDGELIATTKRTWNPMDGAREPHCPYTDRVVEQARYQDGAARIIEHGVEVESNWWNPSALSNASTRLFILERPVPSGWGTFIVGLSASTGHLTGGRLSARVRVLSVNQPDDPAVAACIAEFACSVGGTSAS